MAAARVNIEVDGQPLEAAPGTMLIEVTDGAGIYIPRFCYHRYLSVAANCRMCLVDVEKAPKPLPACATPVMDGMKVQTRSARALDAQRSVMEFLLINHPLDCPICDQGGECELQDLAMGFGRDVSRYQERKRVVPDRNIGPLVRTDLTRCIHCTRCVRFGEEIAGLRELGTLHRGEQLEIGTYVERSMRSELSGNVIDLCPVGALTSKPFRYSARAWELREHRAVAPHDAVGSNVCLHVASDRIMRVVPEENPDINEVWLSDRDRFSYQGLYHPERLTEPMIRNELNELQPVDWDTALRTAARGLQQLREAQGAAAIGALLSASATVEEAFLLQRLMRGLGSPHIDHRTWQCDFSADAEAPPFPWLGCAITDLEHCDAVLLVGAHPRTQQPMINHRLRKAALSGAAVCRLVDMAYPCNFPLAESILAAPSALPVQLHAILQAASGAPSDTAPDTAAGRIAARLAAGQRTLILLGEGALSHPACATLCRLAARLAEHCGGMLGMLPPGANSAGAWLAGAVPHRGPLLGARQQAGYNCQQMLEQRLPGWLLLGVEPELDCLDSSLAREVLHGAEFKLYLAAYDSEFLRSCADVVLPIAQYAESPGTLVNIEGRVQHFTAAVPPPGAVRPAWKVLRVLGNHLQLDGFQYRSCEEVYAELADGLQQLQPGSGDWRAPPATVAAPPSGDGSHQHQLERCGGPGMYAVDALVRHADALQQTGGGGDAIVRVSAESFQALQLQGERVQVQRGETRLVLPLAVAATVPPGCVHIHSAHPDTTALGPPATMVRLSRAE